MATTSPLFRVLNPTLQMRVAAARRGMSVENYLVHAVDVTEAEERSKKVPMSEEPRRSSSQRRGEIRERVCRERRAGTPVAGIAERFGVSEPTIYRILNQCGLTAQKLRQQGAGECDDDA